MSKGKSVLSVFRDDYGALLTVFCMLLLAGCGGGGSSSSSGDGPGGAVLSGVFLDAPVAGLYYQTETLDGYTDAEGTFLYRAGETVAFSLQDLPLGQAAAGAVVTPIDIVPGAVDETHPTVTNLCLLLQTLDEDGDPDNGIVLSEEIAQAVEGRDIDLTQDIADFIEDPQLDALLQELNDSGAFTDGENRELRTAQQAQQHLQTNLAEQDQDGDGYTPNQGDCDDDNDAVHPGATEICGDGIDQDCSGSDLACPVAESSSESSYESTLRDLISDYRQQNGLGRLAFDADLYDLSQEHSESMQSNGVMSHDGFTNRYNRSGYGICVENVGWNYPTAQAMFTGWRNSSGHNANMLNGRIDFAGVSREGAYTTFFACGN